jgi:hypothetical protein
VSPSSFSRVSTTWVLGSAQYGHFMNAPPLAAITVPGNFLHMADTSPRTRASTASSFGASSTSAIRLATCSASISVKPRVVMAGVPRRMPEVTKGFCGSLGWRSCSP